MSTTEIWDRFSDQLRLFIYRRVTDRQDAEDLLQDVFLKIHSHIDSLHSEERLAPWVYQIARNTITDYYRNRKPTVELPDTLQAEQEEIEQDPISRLAFGVKGMIESLPEIYQQPLILSEIYGVKQAEVADHLGLSVSGAKSRIQRGKAMLKQSLLDCCHFEFDRRGSVIDYIPHQECCTRWRPSECSC
jgi:RNA polymerase sigma-70 factor (ECF subfamily)